MSKPTWEGAPPWANWLAQDEDGSWNWFEVEPSRTDNLPYNFWVSFEDTRSTEHCTSSVSDLWTDTLESRNADI